MCMLRMGVREKIHTQTAVAKASYSNMPDNTTVILTYGYHAHPRRSFQPPLHVIDVMFNM